MRSYDAVVIGSGQVGEPLAIEFARAGLQTVLVDSDHDATCACCGPSNAMLASANVARLARRATHFGVETGSVEVDFGKVQLRRLSVMDGFRTQAMQALETTPGLTVVKGEAQFQNADSLVVRDTGDAAVELQAARIFINTGAYPALPDLPGLADVPYLTSSSAMELETLPDELLVLGGSYLGVELGQMFRRFGSRVSIIERKSQLLPHEDRDIAAAVAENLREDGVGVFLETEAIGVASDPGGAVRVKARTPFGERVLTGSHLLVVAGHEPKTRGLNLAAAGIAVDERGYIKVNERLETSAHGVYALGAVNGGPAFAHVAYDDFRVVRANVLANGHATITRLTCPYTAFLDPQLGRIGLTETQAREQSRAIKVAKLPMNRVARAVELNESGGLMKVIVDADTQRILGAAVLGVDSREIIAILQIAMMADMPYTALRDSMFAHPTLVGSLDNLFAALHH
ncbi:MAG: mercuric reductase [Burkholderiales bacterium]|jgi:pyruvate/2-oxoglutarate dehydrogenase complex dihydrolipoamide dehydrogenase (E3) component